MRGFVLTLFTAVAFTLTASTGLAQVVVVGCPTPPVYAAPPVYYPQAMTIPTAAIPPSSSIYISYELSPGDFRWTRYEDYNSLFRLMWDVMQLERAGFSSVPCGVAANALNQYTLCPYNYYPEAVKGPKRPTLLSPMPGMPGACPPVVCQPACPPKCERPRLFARLRCR
jgi:hypothetical protein